MEPDKELIRLVLKKDRKSQITFYKLCFNTLMSVAVRYKKNEEEAAELVNNAFLKIINNLNKKKKNVPFEAWIRRIILNEVIDDFRKNKRRNEIFSHKENIENYNDSVINDVESTIEEERLSMMLMKLPKATRNVFNLCAIDGYSHKEIAEMLNITVETSKWHVKQARKTLKELIKQEEIV